MPSKPSLDRDAQEALAWIESGMPDSKVSYGPDAPKLTPDQLQQFKPASYMSEPDVIPAPRTLKKTAR
jgi:hypothetical protein